MKVLVTGANGFVGKNLIATLNTMPNIEVLSYDRENTEAELEIYTKECDFVFNLAGINRPKTNAEFYEGNANFTKVLCENLKANNNQATVVVTSSIQAALDNEYGKSKKEGEDYLRLHGSKNQSKIIIYRLKNLFGKWCQPNYNSVVATWCYNVANDIELLINNPAAELELCYIDDVVNELLNALMGQAHIKEGYGYVEPTYTVSLEALAAHIRGFKQSRETKACIETGDPLIGKLYSTYLSYLKTDDFMYDLNMNCDDRGSFTEFLKTGSFGQVSVNISKPGIIKGNHWHHTKNEKFLVVTGTGVIRFRNIHSEVIIEYKVSGGQLQVVDIPTGYTHNIENTGKTEMVTLMWASEPFDPEKSDTYFLEV